MGDPPPELNDENSKKKAEFFISENLKGLKEIIEKINLFRFFSDYKYIFVPDSKELAFSNKSRE